jgi:hypothetical protein
MTTEEWDEILKDKDDKFPLYKQPINKWKYIYPTKESIIEFFKKLRESFEKDAYWLGIKQKIKEDNENH